METATTQCDSSAQRNTPFECLVTLHLSANPPGSLDGYAETEITASFSKPGSAMRTAFAFWDGDNPANGEVYYRIRSFLPETGTWEIAVSCAAGPCTGAGSLAQSSISIDITDYPGSNPLYIHGMPFPVSYSWNDTFAGVTRTWKALGQGNPDSSRFLPWIGDSAWAGPLRATNSEWTQYLNDRRGRGFTVIHVGPAPYWAKPETGGTADLAFDEVAGCTVPPSEQAIPNSCSRVIPSHWEQFRDRVQEANEKGLLVFVTGLMEPIGGPSVATRYPKTQDAKNFARNLAARLSGDFVIFSPGFDSPPNTAAKLDLMKAVGAEIDRVAPHHLISNHFGSVNVDSVALLQGESWLDFQMFQSGAFANGANYDEAEQLGLVTQRAREMPGDLIARSPAKASINGEAIYDDGEPLEADAEGRTFHRNAFRARQTAYLTWLNGSFGHSLGVGGIWDWNLCSLAESVRPDFCEDDPPGGADTARARNPSWDTMAEGLGKLSSRSMQHLGSLLRSVGPADGELFLTPFEQTRILKQPTEAGAPIQHRQMALGRDPHTLLAYLPENKMLVVSGLGLAGYPPAHRWYDVKTEVYEPPLPSASPGLNCPSGLSSCAADYDFCTTNPGCLYCNAVAQPSLCAFINRAHDADAGNSDRVFVVDLDPGQPESWAGVGAAVLRVWSGRTSKNEEWGIDAELRDSSGQPLGSWFRLNDTLNAPPVFASHPSVAADGGGNFAVAWQDDVDQDGYQEIRLRWLPNGVPTGSELVVSGEAGDHAGSSVAVAADGATLVAWIRKSDAFGAPIHPQILVQRLDFAAKTVGTPEAYSPDSGDVPSTPQVAATEDGSFALVWVEKDLASSTRTVRGVILDSDLRPESAEFQVNQSSADLFRIGRAYFDAGGLLTVEWEALGAVSGDGLYARTFTPTGTAASSETVEQLYETDGSVDSGSEENPYSLWEVPW